MMISDSVWSDRGCGWMRGSGNDINKIFWHDVIWEKERGICNVGSQMIFFFFFFFFNTKQTSFIHSLREK